MQLILGNLNYSSWSIRGALVARGSGLEIPEKVVPLGFADTKAELIATTGLHTVPVLVKDDLIIRDSMAIAEWIAEEAGPGAVWPEAAEKRAIARSVCAEMHSGFLGLRSKMPVNIRARSESPTIEGDLKTDIERVTTIWATLRKQHKADGDFLFGAWSAADAFYAPVVTRFRTYGYKLSGVLADYSDAVWEHDLIQTLRTQAEAEPWEIEMGDLGPVRAWVRE